MECEEKCTVRKKYQEHKKESKEDGNTRRDEPEK